ncbi:MAG: ribose-5-phosphate isomerase RpiA [Flavisolibacter sp.]|nr:ribose-5-phosphate isomerase RpiA [Flavisolibacter sp.]
MNAKQIAADYAVESVKDGMTVGIGTGSTSAFAIEALGRKVQQGLFIKAVASSIRSEEAATNVGIKLIPFSEVETIDIYIDGADEVDKDLHLIKGGGGALLREKILAFNSKEFLVIVDSSKLVEHLGKFLLPVEIIPFAMELTLKQLQKLGCTTKVRQDGKEPYITDNSNLIIDCDFKRIEQVDQIHQSINAIPGVVENGLFTKNIVSKIIVGYESGEVKVIEK